MHDSITLTTWGESHTFGMVDGGGLVGHGTRNELDAISNWITPDLLLSRMYQLQIAAYKQLLTRANDMEISTGQFSQKGLWFAGIVKLLRLSDAYMRQ